MFFVYLNLFLLLQEYTIFCQCELMQCELMQCELMQRDLMRFELMQCELMQCELMQCELREAAKKKFLHYIIFFDNFFSPHNFWTKIALFFGKYCNNQVKMPTDKL